MAHKNVPGTWANDIGFTLVELGEGSSWFNNIPIDLSAVKYKLWDDFDTRWKDELGSKVKLECLREIKTNLHVLSIFLQSNIEKNK